MAAAIPRHVLTAVLQDATKPIGQRMRTIFFLKGLGERQDAEVLEKGANSVLVRALGPTTRKATLC